MSGKFVVETWENRGGQWTAYGIGENTPRSRKECEEDIETLEMLGGDWAEADYRVSRVR